MNHKRTPYPKTIVKHTALSKTQLRANLVALQALIDDKEIEYYSPALAAWCQTGEVCCDFEHRVKPDKGPDGQLDVAAAVATSLPQKVSTNVEDY